MSDKDKLAVRKEVMDHLVDHWEKSLKLPHMDKKPLLQEVTRLINSTEEIRLSRSINLNNLAYIAKKVREFDVEVDISGGRSPFKGKTPQQHAQQSVTQQSVAQQSVAQQLVAQQSVSQQSAAKQSVAQQSVAQQSVAQQSVAQHSVAQQLLSSFSAVTQHCSAVAQ